MRFNSINGDYNLYCQWYHQNCSLVPADTPKRSLIVSLPDISFSLNQTIRQWLDFHVSKNVDRMWCPVVRYTTIPFFSSVKDLPVYISLYDLFDKGNLKIVVENKYNTPKWLSIKCENSFMGTAHTLLHSGLDFLYYVIITEIENMYANIKINTLEVCLNFKDLDLGKHVLNTEVVNEKKLWVYPRFRC